MPTLAYADFLQSGLRLEFVKIQNFPFSDLGFQGALKVFILINGLFKSWF